MFGCSEKKPAATGVQFVAPGPSTPVSYPTGQLQVGRAGAVESAGLCSGHCTKDNRCADHPLAYMPGNSWSSGIPSPVWRSLQPHLRHLLSVALAGFQVPALQSWHSVAPWPSAAKLMAPAGQGVQAAAPGADEKVPGGHTLQVCEPGPSAYSPGLLHKRMCAGRRALSWTAGSRLKSPAEGYHKLLGANWPSSNTNCRPGVASRQLQAHPPCRA